MGIEEIAQGKYILWGANWSLYTAKVRPYLIKKGIDYVELNPSHPHFHDSIVPRIGHITVPVVEATDGELCGRLHRNHRTLRTALSGKFHDPRRQGARGAGLVDP